MICNGCGYNTVYKKHWRRKVRATKIAEAEAEAEAKTEAEVEAKPKPKLTII